MASNRIRALRNTGNRLVNYESKINFSTRRPAPRRLADNFIFTNNVRREAIVEPLIAVDAITTEKIVDDAITNDEIAADAVDTEQIRLDAIDGKNITSCNITDSTLENCDGSNLLFDDVTGSNYEIETLTASDFTLETGTIEDADVTNSRLDGADVILTGCTLSDCLADTITSIGGGMTIVADPLGVVGSFTVVGSTAMTVGEGAFGVTVGGTGISLAAGSINIDAGSYENVSFNGQIITPQVMFLNEVADIYQAIAAVQSAVDALGPCACP